MSMDLGTAVLRMGADVSGLAEGMKRIEGQIEGFTGRSQNMFQKMGSVMGGVLGAQAITGMVNGIKNMGMQALNSYAEYEKLGMSLESLIARDIRLASAQTKTITTGKQRISLTADEQAKVADLSREYQIMELTLKEQQLRYNELVKKYGEGGIATQKAALQMQDYQGKMAGVRGEIDKLNAKQGQYVTTTQTSTEYTLTLEEAMAQSKDKAAELTQWIETLAIKSPFDSEGVAQALRMSMAYGNNVDQAKRLTQALIDFSSASGGSTQQMQRISLALGQMQAKGKVSGEEMRQLTEAGLPVNQILSQAFGKTTAELEKMREKGLLPANKAIEAITKYLETNFAGAAEKQATSWAGLLTTMQEVKTITLRDFFSGIFKAVQPLVALLADTLSSDAFRARIKAFGDTLGNSVKNVVEFAMQAKDAIQGFAGLFTTDMTKAGDASLKLTDALFNIGQKFGMSQEQAEIFSQSVAGVLDKVAQIGNAFQEGGLPAVGELLGKWFGEAVAYVQTNAPAWGEQIKAAIAQAWAYLTTTALPAVGEMLAQWWQTAVTYVQTNAPLWAAQLKQALAQIWQNLTVVDTGNFTQLTRFGEIVATIQSAFARAKPVIDAVAGALAGLAGAAGLMKLITLVPVLLGHLSALGGILATVIAAINPVTVAIAALVAGFVLLGAYLATHRDLLAAVGAYLSGVFGPMLQRIREAIGTLGQQFEAIKPKIAALGEALKPVITVIGTVVTAFAALVAMIAVTVAKAFGETLAAIIKNAGDIFGGLIDTVTGVVNTVVNLVEAFVETVVAVFTGDWAKAGVAWGAVWESIKQIAAGAVELVGAIIKTLAEILTNTIGDLIPAAKAKMEEFKAGIVKWIEEAIEAIKKWLGISSPSTVMIGIATDMIQGLIDGVGAMIESVKAKLGEVLQAIKDVFDKPLEILMSIGENIIAGLQAGIEKAWGGLKEKVMGLIAQLPAGVRKFLGIESPSKVFQQIGQLIIEGLQLGLAEDTDGTLATLTAHVSVIVSAFENLANNVIGPAAVASAKAITDPISEIMDNLLTIISGVQGLAGFKSDLDALGVVGLLDSLNTAVTEIVNSYAALAGAFVNRGIDVWSAKAVTDPLAEILDNLTAIVGGVTALNEYASLTRVDVTQAIADLEYALGLLIPALDRVAAMVGDMGIAAGILAQNVGPAMATLRDAVETVASLATLAGTELSSDQIRGAVHTMIDNMGVMLYEIQYALNGAAEYGFVLLNLNDQIKKWLVDIQPVAQNLNGLVSAWTGIQQIAGFEPLQSDVLRKTVRRMIDQLGLVLYEIQYSLTGAAEYGFVLANLNDWIKGLLPEINAVAGNLSQLVGAWAGIRQVADLEPVSSDVLSTAIRQMVNQLGAVIYELQMLANQHPELLALNDELATSIAQLAELAQSFANLVTGALAALTALAVDVIIPEALVPKIAMIGLFAGRVAETLGVVAKCIDYRLLEKTREFAENASALFGLLQPALEAVELLAEDVVVPDMALIRVAAIGLFAGQVAQTLGVIAECIDYKLLAKTREFADNTGAVLGIIKTALETMTALTRKIELPDKLDDKLDDLAEFIDKAVSKLGAVAEQIDDDLESEAKNLSEAVTSVMGGLKAALELALSLPEEWAPPDETTWNAFFNWAIAVFEAFVKKVQQWTSDQVTDQLHISADETTVIGAVAQSFGQVMAGLKAALELALAVPKEWTLPDEATWAAFFTWATGVYAAFVKKVQEWTAEQEDPENEAGIVGAVGSAFGSVMQGLAAAFDVFTGLRTYMPVLQTQMDLFLQEVLYIYRQIAIFAIGPGVAAATEAVSKFAEANQAIFGGLGDALSLFQELAESMPTDWETFIWKIEALLNRVIATFDGFVLAAEAAGEWTAAAQTFADALAMVVGVLSDALTLFQDLAENGAPSTAKLETFLAAILGVFGDIETGLAQTAVTAQETLQTIAGLFAEGEIALRAWGEALAAAFSEAFIKTLTDGLDEIETTVKSAVDVAAGYNIKALADSHGKAIGVAIGQGFINGVISTAQELADAIVAVINAGIGAAEYVLGVASPSKVFFGIGENVGLGLTGGVLDALPSVERASAALAGALGPAFGGGRLSAQVGVNSTRRVVVDFRGQAGGGVPMDEMQFARLKRELAYAIQLGG